jgi:hypothetical protein
MPKPTLDFHPSTSFPSTTTAHLTTHHLSQDPVTGDQTVLLTHAPNSAWGGRQDDETAICTHDYWEEAYIVSGRLFDANLQKWFGAGDYCCRPPGMVHGPFKADEKEGCREVVWMRYPRVSEEVVKG